MRKIQLIFIPVFALLLSGTTLFAQGNYPDAQEIIDLVDKNMRSETRIIESEMVIHGARKTMTVSSKSYSQGEQNSFTEYLSPEREKGVKMLKLEDMLWIYSPSTDKTIQISGHMLKQSLMGSDLSYEDMMENRELNDMYKSVVTGDEVVGGRDSWIIEMKAIVDDATYDSRKVWIDKERSIPMKEELFAKSGQLLKTTTMSDIQLVDGRWFPMKMNYKDNLKSGNGTDFIIRTIEFDKEIPAYLMSKAALKK